MKIINVAGYKYIDKELKDYIDKIWANFDNDVKDDSNILFCKNTTTNRSISDITKLDVRRVIKKEKADYVVIQKINIGNFYSYYDSTTNTITSDNEKEPVVKIGNFSAKIQETIEQIQWFAENKPDVIWIDENIINRSINNSVVIDKDNYTTFEQLLSSNSLENKALAFNMIGGLDMDKSLDWILYVIWASGNQFHGEPSNIVRNFINSHPKLKLVGGSQITTPQRVDTLLEVVKDPDVLYNIKSKIREDFNRGITNYLKGVCNTSKFTLADYTLLFNDEEKSETDGKVEDDTSV